MVKLTSYLSYGAPYTSFLEPYYQIPKIFKALQKYRWKINDAIYIINALILLCAICSMLFYHKEY